MDNWVIVDIRISQQFLPISERIICTVSIVANACILDKVRKNMNAERAIWTRSPNFERLI